jgi:hypothetical protein
MKASGDGAKILFGSAVEWLAAPRHPQMLCVQRMKSNRKKSSATAENLCLHHPTGPATKTQIHLFAKWIFNRFSQ